MAVINDNDQPHKIILMEGWDGSNPASNVGGMQSGWWQWGDMLWPGYRMWQRASHDASSPSNKAPCDDPAGHIFTKDFVHTPDENNWAGTPYEGKGRALLLMHPDNSWFHEGEMEVAAGSKVSMIWRSGSGVDSDKTNGFQDILDTSTAYLGFAFMFPEWQNYVLATESFPSGSDGMICAWMGDAQKSGFDAAGNLDYIDDPGEPSAYAAGQGAGYYQEFRLCMNIRSGSSDNLYLYRSGQGPGPTPAQWAFTGSFEIKSNKWYWCNWAVFPEGPGIGWSKVWIDGNLVAETDGTVSTKDTNTGGGGSQFISNVAFALRGHEGPLRNDPMFGFAEAGSYNNTILIDDVVIHYSSSSPVVGPETPNPLDLRDQFCIILSASALEDQNNWTPGPGAVDLLDGVREYGSPARWPQVDEWDETLNNTVNKMEYIYPTFPYTTADVDFHGIQAMNLCSQTLEGTFTAIPLFNWVTQSLFRDVSEIGHELNTYVPVPGSGPSHYVPSFPYGVAYGLEKYNFMRQRIWPTSSISGVSFTLDEVNALTSSVKLKTGFVP